MTLSPAIRDAVLTHLDRFSRESRGVGATDQDVAEFMLEVGARWLHSHGVSADSVHTWIDQAMRRPAPAPLVAAARSRNDFGGRR